ncbi:PROTEIN FD-LIKE [Salix koriyanagi]|uniref:PROTEIN FD-LIKE n=1 Tax=Salix koriyanagi TaxID=2511006 RepID=A0A9Q0QLZ2_9ROSI|nr:PROTEIN FD-LIKE [Salix koriyanagi]
MEEVWNDINLASLHEQPSNYTGSNANANTNTNDHVLHGMTFQDLLATSSNKDTPTRVASKEPSSGGGNNLLKNSLGPSPATMLNLNYGKRPHENGDVSGGDRRHERMIKNRESAARSRARKQAYTTELELKVAMLGEENAKLRKQQERVSTVEEECSFSFFFFLILFSRYGTLNSHKARDHIIAFKSVVHTCDCSSWQQLLLSHQKSTPSIEPQQLHFEK